MKPGTEPRAVFDGQSRREYYVDDEDRADIVHFSTFVVFPKGSHMVRCRYSIDRPIARYLVIKAIPAMHLGFRGYFLGLGLVNVAFAHSHADFVQSSWPALYQVGHYLCLEPSGVIGKSEVLSGSGACG